MKIFIIGLRIALGALFIFAGIQKFKSTEEEAQTKTEQKVTEDLSDNEVKIEAFIGGLKQADYFWPFLGVAEILCGLLLLSQVLSLLGAVMLVPMTLNIFLFHLFLEPDELGELLMTLLYLLANLGLIGYDYPKLKQAFLSSTK